MCPHICPHINLKISKKLLYTWAESQASFFFGAEDAAGDGAPSKGVAPSSVCGWGVSWSQRRLLLPGGWVWGVNASAGTGTERSSPALILFEISVLTSCLNANVCIVSDII